MKPEQAAKYKSLNDVLLEKCYFEYVLLNDYAPINARY